MAVAGIRDRRAEHLGQRHGAVIAQQHHPGVEGAGHAGRQQAGAGDEIEPKRLAMRNGQTGRRNALPAQHLGAVALGIVQNDRHVAARTVEVRLDHLKRESGGATGVESIAALFQDRHADRGGDPMGRRHHAEGTFDFRTCREWRRIDKAHGAPSESNGGGPKRRQRKWDIARECGARRLRRSVARLVYSAPRRRRHSFGPRAMYLLNVAPFLIRFGLGPLHGPPADGKRSGIVPAITKQSV